MPAMKDVSRIIPDTTEMNGWSRVASGEAKESWRDRAELAAAFLRSGDAVCDLGAGSQPLRIFLPEGAKYIPVDCVDTLPGTHLADFDTADFTLPAQNFNVVTALGVLNWLKDEEAFLARLSELAEGKFFIFTYDLWGAQRKLGSLDGCMTVFSRYIRDLAPAIVFRRRVLFTGTFGRGEANGAFRAPATNIYLKYLRPQEYLVLKLLKLKMMPRWLA
jgi:methyltransferase family protein